MFNISVCLCSLIIFCFFELSFARSTEMGKVLGALGAAEIQRSGVDGKGVHVLAMDSYDNAAGDERSHGELVIEFLKRMAPGAAATHVEFKNSDILHTDLTQSHRDDIVDIINMSSVWNKKSLWRQENETIKYFAENGALIVIAAGNSAQVFGESLDQKEIAQLAFEINTNPDIPGAILFAGQAPLPGAKRSLPISIFSERAGIVAPYYLVAPNQGSLTEDKKGNLGPTQGTSFAAPTIVGLAALLKSGFPSLRGKQLAHLLLSSASSIQISDREKEKIFNIFSFALDKNSQEVLDILVPEHEKMPEDQVKELIGFYFSGRGIPNLGVAFDSAQHLSQNISLPAIKHEALAASLRFEQYNALVPEEFARIQNVFERRVRHFLKGVTIFEQKRTKTQGTILDLKEKRMINIAAIYGKAAYTHYGSLEDKKEAIKSLHRIAKEFKELSLLGDIANTSKQKFLNYLGPISKKLLASVGDYIANKTYDWRDPMYDVDTRNSELQFAQDIIGDLLKSSYISAEEKTTLLTYLERFRLTQISRP